MCSGALTLHALVNLLHAALEEALGACVVRPARHNAHHAENNNKIADTQNNAVLSFKCLDPGSGRKILAMWHGAGAYPGVLIQKSST